MTTIEQAKAQEEALRATETDALRAARGDAVEVYPLAAGGSPADWDRGDVMGLYPQRVIDMATIEGSPQRISPAFAQALAACGVELVNVRIQDVAEVNNITVGTFESVNVSLELHGELAAFSPDVARQLAGLIVGSAIQAEENRAKAATAEGVPAIMRALPTVESAS